MGEDRQQVSPELLQQVFQLCSQYSNEIVGPKKTRELLEKSYQTILPYLHVLKSFQLDDNRGLEIKCNPISDKELLAFALWIQQFIKELKQFMIGLGQLNIESLTEPIQQELEEIGFYEFCRQAQELEYD